MDFRAQISVFADDPEISAYAGGVNSGNLCEDKEAVAGRRKETKLTEIGGKQHAPAKMATVGLESTTAIKA